MRSAPLLVAVEAERECVADEEKGARRMDARRRKGDECGCRSEERVLCRRGLRGSRRR